MTSAQARYRIATGVWRHVAGKAYAVARERPWPHEELHAMGLTWSDATLYGVSAVRYWEPDAPHCGPRLICCAVPHSRRPQPGLARRVVAVPDGYVVVREGVRIQRRTPALVAALLALPPSEGQSLLAWMVARRKVDAEEFARIVAEHNGHPGVRRLRMYAPMVAARAASKAELVARSILISGSVEGWEPNALVRGVDGQAKSADFLFSAEKLIVMVDGWRYHGDRSAFQMDRHDQNALIQAGYLVLRFTWQDLEHRPGYVLEQIAEARALARRRAGPGAS